MKRRKGDATTIKYEEVVNCITTDVWVEDVTTGKGLKTIGIWDTGATNSVVTESVAKALNLPILNYTKVRGIHGVKTVPVYYVKIALRDCDISLVVDVTECDELSNDGSIGLLIGMDLISKGDFAISNFKGKTTMSFRVPSQEVIDFE